MQSVVASGALRAPSDAAEILQLAVELKTNDDGAVVGEPPIAYHDVPSRHSKVCILIQTVRYT